MLVSGIKAHILTRYATWATLLGPQDADADSGLFANGHPGPCSRPSITVARAL